MIGFFKQLYRDFITTRDQVSRIESHIKTICDRVEDEFSDEMIMLTRHSLGSVDLTDVEIEMTSEQREAYNSQVFAAYDTVILPTLKRLSRTQEGFIARNAANWDQSLFGRGTLNGIELVLEEFEKANNAHKETLKQPEPPSQPFNPMPER